MHSEESTVLPKNQESAQNGRAAFSLPLPDNNDNEEVKQSHQSPKFDSEQTFPGTTINAYMPPLDPQHTPVKGIVYVKPSFIDDVFVGGITGCLMLLMCIVLLVIFSLLVIMCVMLCVADSARRK